MGFEGLTVYASSAETWDTFPPRLRLFPLGPRATVRVRPIILNENKSPYYDISTNLILKSAWLCTELRSYEALFKHWIVDECGCE